MLTPLEESSLLSTPADAMSIMCYQLPGSITKDGMPIPGGMDINQSDYDFAGRIYLKPASAPASGRASGDGADRDESDDPDVLDRQAERRPCPG